MRHCLLILLFALLPAELIISQSVKGKITDTGGKAVAYATVYVQELRQGTTSNAGGEYELNIPSGKYLIFFQSLGYEPAIIDLTVGEETITRDVVLNEQFYEIPEVLISPSGEDPAYSIMRRAIGLAPYHLNQVSHYRADVYLKGNLIVNKIPKIVTMSVKMDRNERSATVSAGGREGGNEGSLKEGDLYFMESFNEVEFNAPDRYVQKVISVNSTFPESNGYISPMDFIQASFYQPVLADMAISPLSPQAFSHYNFSYLGASPQGDYTINKIGVKPKRKSQQLFEGTIYIVDELWCIHSLDLTNNNIIGRIRIRELAVPVRDEIWMPVSYNFDVNVSILGFKSDIGYTSSIKYLDITPDTRLKRPEEFALLPGVGKLPSDTLPVSANGEKIGKILNKEELSNRDMVTLARLMKKESETGIADTVSQSPAESRNTTLIYDEDAAKKDQEYWASVRPVPLTPEELTSLASADSLKKLRRQTVSYDADSLDGPGNRKSSRFLRQAGDIIFGHTWADTSGTSFRSGGLVNPSKIGFNTVDGFVYGTDFSISKKFGNGSNLFIIPELRYAFSRQKLMWKLNANITTGGKRPGQFYVRTGVVSKDFNLAGGIDPLVNTLTTLFLRRNYMKLYESRYLNLGYRAAISDRVTLVINAGYENRRMLQNNTDYSFFSRHREYTDNIPGNSLLTPDSHERYLPENQKHFSFEATAEIVPGQPDRLPLSRRPAVRSAWPDISLTWKHGMNQEQVNSDSYRHFDMIKLEVSDRYDAGAFSEFRWRFRTGTFINREALSFVDFFHFNAQPFWFLPGDYEDAVMLPGYYALSTSDLFAELHAKYTTPYLLVKLLPVVSNTLVRENLSLLYLGSQFHGNYFELGYSLSEIFLFAEAGVYLGFDDFRYKSTGFKLTLRFN